MQWRFANTWHTRKYLLFSEFNMCKKKKKIQTWCHFGAKYVYRKCACGFWAQEGVLSAKRDFRAGSPSSRKLESWMLPGTNKDETQNKNRRSKKDALEYLTNLPNLSTVTKNHCIRIATLHYHHIPVCTWYISEYYTRMYEYYRFCFAFVDTRAMGFRILSSKKPLLLLYIPCIFRVLVWLT